jgi:hypothetical protein
MEINEGYVPSELSSGISNTHLPSGPSFFSSAALDERGNVALHYRSQRSNGLGRGSARALWMLGGSLSHLHLRGERKKSLLLPIVLATVRYELAAIRA